MYLVNLKSLRLLIYLSGLFSLFLIIYYVIIAYLNLTDRWIFLSNFKIYISNYNKNILKQNERKINFLMMQQQRVSNYLDGNGRNPQMKQKQKEILSAINQMAQGEIVAEKYDEKVVKNRIIREKVKLMSESLDLHKIDIQRDNFVMSEDLLIYNKTISNVQIFYYLPVKWYKAENQSVYQLNTVFYPKRGLYNYSTVEHARKILKAHFNEIRLCGIGVIILHWDPQNSLLSDLLHLVFHTANELNARNQENSLKIAIQIGDYQDRTVESIRNNIKFFVDNFTGNPSFFKVYSARRQKSMPMFYLKNAERIKDWGKLLSKNGIITIRDTNYDSLILAHLE